MMRTGLAVGYSAFFSGFVGAAVFVASQICVVRANASFAGHWEGEMNDLPGIDLKIEEREGKISGKAIFYYQERSDPNGPWQTKGEYPVPLLVPRVEGDVLTFEVEHHKCHDCKELDANAKFRMKLTGANEARIWRLEPGKTPTDDGLKLVREPDSKKKT
jgi:hypothetical protein